MASKKSNDKRPYIIAFSFFVILFILMKVQDVRTESVADNPFDVIQKQSSSLTAPESKRLPSSEH